MTLPRQPAPAPPRGARKAMTLGVKLRAALRLAGLDPDQPIDFDHDPPLGLRLWDEEAGDFIPPSNDDRYIVPRGKPVHAEKTAKRDIPEIARTKRLSSDQEEHRRRMLAKAPGQEKPQSRWPKRKMGRAR